MLVSDFHTNTKEHFWEVVHRLINITTSSSFIRHLPSFSVTRRNYFCFTDIEKAKCLNGHFVSLSKVLDENVQLRTLGYQC